MDENLKRENSRQRKKNIARSAECLKKILEYGERNWNENWRDVNKNSNVKNFEVITKRKVWGGYEGKFKR